MAIPWRTTLVQMQQALQGAGSTLPLSAAKEGYSLTRLLTIAGTAYDAGADDGATNTSPFAAIVATYVAQSEPVFLELDRFARYIFSEHLSSPLMTPICALEFGVITQAQAANWQSYLSAVAAGVAPPAGAIIPALSPAAPLPYDRTYSNTTSVNIANRSTQATTLAAGTSDAVVLGNASGAWFSGQWVSTDNVTMAALTSPPVNPSASVESSSAFLTTVLNGRIASCTSWLAATAFV